MSINKSKAKESNLNKTTERNGTGLVMYSQRTSREGYLKDTLEMNIWSKDDQYAR